MRRRTTGRLAAPWSPRRLRLLLLSGAAMSVLAVAVLVWTVVQVVVRDGGSDSDESSPEAGDQPVEETTAGLSAARPGPLSTLEQGRIGLPAATELGPGGVPTGFPDSPEGALAQLAAIDQTALAGASLPAAQVIAKEWIAPGGPDANDWSVVRALDEMLTASGQPGAGSDLRLTVEPTMGAFRNDGTLTASADDPSAPIACVDFVVSLTTSSTDQIAAADCQRMTRTGSRWVIATGPEEPAPASLWPGSAESVEAGWSWLEVTS